MTSFSRSINAFLAALLAASVTGVWAAPLPGDGDGDGVPDERDECPYSGAGEKVNAEGCSTSVDADGDGIPDRSDLCPYSTLGAKVDATGCAIDEDMDGVANAQDQCPNTPFGEKVDAHGCEIVTMSSKKRGAAKKEEPVPVTKLAPSGPAKVIVKTNPNYVDENELFAAPPPRPEARTAEPVVIPARPAAPTAPVAAVPAQPGEAVIVQVKPSRELERVAPAAAVPAPAAPAPVVSAPQRSTVAAAPVRSTTAATPAAVPQAVESVIVQVKPSREIEPAAPVPEVEVPAAAAAEEPAPVAPTPEPPPPAAPMSAAPPSVSVGLAGVPLPAATAAIGIPLGPRVVIPEAESSRGVELASPTPAAPAPPVVVSTAKSVPAPVVSAAPVRREPAVVEPKTESPQVVLTPERPRASAEPAPAVAVTAKPVPAPVVAPVAPAPVAASIPVPAAPARREPAVVELKAEQPKVVLTPEELRANAEQRATMSPASTDRTPSLPKAATVTLHVQSLPADQFPPGYTPNRAAAQVNVGAGATAAQRGGTPVVAVAPAGDASPRAALPAPSLPDQSSAAETLSEIGFAAGSSQLSPAATQQLRQLASTISSRLSNNPGLVLRLAGHRHAGESAEVESGRGLALRKALIDEGIDDSRIRIVIIDGPRADTGTYQVAVQLVSVQ